MKFYIPLVSYNAPNYVSSVSHNCISIILYWPTTLLFSDYIFAWGNTTPERIRIATNSWTVPLLTSSTWWRNLCSTRTSREWFDPETTLDCCGWTESSSSTPTISCQSVCQFPTHWLGSIRPCSGLPVGDWPSVWRTVPFCFKPVFLRFSAVWVTVRSVLGLAMVHFTAGAIPVGQWKYKFPNSNSAMFSMESYRQVQGVGCQERQESARGCHSLCNGYWTAYESN